jgi:glucose/arabinose dehydrogenase
MRLVRRIAVAVACVAAIAGCAFGPPPPDEGGEPPNLPSPTPSNFGGGTDGSATIDVLAKHLKAPWGVAFLPDGSALVTERTTSTIVRVGPPQSASGLTVTPVATVSGVDSTGDGGLLGIAVSPDVSRDHTAYVYFSTATDNRIATVVLPADALAAPAGPSGGATIGPSAPPSTLPAAPSTAPPAGSDAPPPAVTPRPIVTGIPHGTTDNGGWLAFGPDHALYASTGDAEHPAFSQDPKSLAGKILRMTTAGKPVAGNSLTYASGLHNVQGFAWDVTKQMYAIDGSTDQDGLIPIEAGANYGWAAPSAAPNSAEVVPPIQTFPAADSGCAGIAAIDNLVTTACLTGQRIWLMQVTGGAVFGSPQPVLTKQYGRLRTIVASPDGSLWITTSNTDGHGHPSKDDDQILRVVVADEGAGKT